MYFERTNGIYNLILLKTCTHNTYWDAVNRLYRNVIHVCFETLSWLWHLLVANLKNLLHYWISWFPDFWMGYCILKRAPVLRFRKLQMALVYIIAPRARFYDSSVIDLKKMFRLKNTTHHQHSLTTYYFSKEQLKYC